MQRHGPRPPRSALGRRLELWSRLVTNWAGSSWAFAVAVLVVLVWLVTGPVFHYSDTWQLVINTGTTIVTFLMVFLIQRSQNKDAMAVHLKLNEIVAALHGASNRLIDAEDLNEAELVKLHKFYKRLAEMSKRDGDLGQSHSVDEAEAVHKRKRHEALGEVPVGDEAHPKKPTS
ncbi:MAG TPA: low affinity iron permease family protein [Polyangia bacterium]|jgi:low affinity Fe/Cu permease|nr:low affinity iron permease family protein [Polyangia bacterium]